MSGKRQNAQDRRARERGAAAVEFALVLPILVVMLLGIIDFGLYFYNDLQLTHVARDAARYLSVGDVDAANATISNANLVSTSAPSSTVVSADNHGDESSITVTAVYTFITPLPLFIPGLAQTIDIDASVAMRRE